MSTGKPFYVKGQYREGLDNSATADYSASIDKSTILRDPKFLNDLRSFYKDKTGYSLDDKTLISNFYEDRTWADLNTVGVIADAASAISSSSEQRARMKRIQSVWTQLPNFFQEGGRGASAIPDIASAIIKDPTNLIPGVAGYKGAVTGARVGVAAGRGALSSGIKAGVGKAAASEAAIGGGVEAIHSGATQARDVTIGLQDEFSTGQLLGSAAIGAATGGVIGGALGVPSAVVGAKIGGKQAEALAKVGYTPEEIQALSQKQVNELFGLSEDGRPLNQIEAPEQPTPEEIIAQEQQVEREALEAAELQAEVDLLTPVVGDYANDLATTRRQLNEAAQAARVVSDRLRKEVNDPAKSTSQDQLDNALADEALLQSLKAFTERAKREAAEIIELEKSNDVGVGKKAEARRRRYTKYMGQVRAVLEATDGSDAEAMLARMEADSFGLRPLPEGKAELPEAETTSNPDANVEVDADANAGVGENVGNKPVAKGEAEEVTGNEPNTPKEEIQPNEASEPLYAEDQPTGVVEKDGAELDGKINPNVITAYRKLLDAEGTADQTKIKSAAIAFEKEIKKHHPDLSTLGVITWVKDNVKLERLTPNPNVITAYKKLRDAENTAAETGLKSDQTKVKRAATALDKQIKKHHPNLSTKDNIALRTRLQEVGETNPDLPAGDAGEAVGQPAVERPDVDAVEEIVPPSERPTVDAEDDPIANQVITDENLGDALAAGLDPAELKPNPKAKKGQITKGVVGRARREKKRTKVPSSFRATQVQEEVETLIKRIEESIPDGDLKEQFYASEPFVIFMEQAGQDASIQSHRRDVKAFAQYLQRNPDVLAAYRKGTGGLNLTSNQSKEAWTKAELQQIKRLIKVINEQNPGISEPARRMMAEERVRQMRGNPKQDSVGSSQDAIDKGGILTTAGRNPETGKPQGFLKKGTPIAKGSDYTITDSRPRVVTFGRDAAMAQAAKKPLPPLKGKKLAEAKKQYKSMIESGIDEQKARSVSGLARSDPNYAGQFTDIVPYIGQPGEVVLGPSGKVVLKKGQTAWADGYTQRAFETREFALKFRGDEVSDKRVPIVVDGAKPKAAANTDDGDSINDALMGQIKDFINDLNGPKTSIDDLFAGLRDVTGGSKATTKAVEQGDAAPSITPEQEKPPVTRGDKKLIVRSKIDPTDIRVITSKQIRNEADVFSIIGQNESDPKSIYENWDVRYADMNAYPRTAKAKEELFNSLPAETTGPISGGRFEAGPNYGLGDPMLMEEAWEVDIELTEEEYLAFRHADAMTIDQRSENFGQPASFPPLPDAAMLKTVDKRMRYGQFRKVAIQYEMFTGWPKDGKARALLAKNVETLNKANQRLMPRGYILPNANRKATIESVDKIFSKYAPEEIAAAKRMLQRLGGDPTVAPYFVTHNAKGLNKKRNFLKHRYDNVNSIDPDQQYINIQTEGIDAHTNWLNTHDPMISTIYHEVAHWAYINILTDADRVEFWKATSKFYDGDGASNKLNEQKVRDGVLLPDKSKAHHVDEDGNVRRITVTSNSASSPQEYFAQQFQLWATQQTPEINNPSFFKRMGFYIREVLERYFDKKAVDPDLEPLFAKILPDDVPGERKSFELGVSSKPVTQEGTVLHSRFMQLQLVQEDIESAIASGSPDGIINSFSELRRYILSVGVNSKKMPIGIGGSGPLLALRNKKGQPQTMLKVLNEKLRALDEIIDGKRSELTSIDDPNFADRYSPDDPSQGLSFEDAANMGQTRDTVEIADMLEDFYHNGYNGKFVPEDGLPAGVGPKNLHISSVSHMIASTRKALQARYQVVERTTDLMHGSVPTSVTKKVDPPRDDDGNVKPSGTKKSKGAARQSKEDDLAAAALNEAKTPKSKRPRNKDKNKPTIDPDDAATGKSMSIKELQTAYIKHKGTDYGDQLGAEIVAKAKAEALAPKKTIIDRAIMKLSGQDLHDTMLRALYDGDTVTLNQAMWEIKYRADKKSSKRNGSKVKPLTRVIRGTDGMIETEIRNNQGVSGVDGVPASARASLRDNLERMTHRDNEVQTSTRTMAYRLYNMLGKTNRGDEETTNLLTTSDMARLAGSDDIATGDNVFGDFSSNDFNKLRKSIRRIAAALNKGDGSPDEAMGDLMHTVVRSGALTDAETDAIVQSYRTLPEPMRKRIEKQLEGKYAERTSYGQEKAIAEEWFAYSVNRYTREEIPRSKILDDIITGDDNNLNMRGTLDRAIDRTIEYTGYIVNGQIGRPDVKERYRRLTFYGDMFENSNARPFSGALEDGLLAHPSYASSYAQDALRSASPSRMANIRTFAKGVGIEPSTGMPIMFYHGTPNGHAFRRTESNPNVLFKKSQTGNYGPGYYLTLNPSVAGDVYARRPSKVSLIRQAEGLNLPKEQKEDMDFDLWSLFSTREEISKTRREFTQLEDELGDNPDVTPQTLEAFKSHLDDLVSEELDLADDLARRGLKLDAYVMPMVIRMEAPADFREGQDYTVQSPLIKAIMAKMNESGVDNSRGVQHISEALSADGGLSGTKTYRALVNGLIKTGRSVDMAKEQLTGILDDLGYDGMMTTHRNTVNDAASEVMENSDTYRASSITHTTAVLFNPEQAKHIDADYFDVNEPTMFSREMSGTPIPRGVSGDVIGALQNDSITSLSEIPTGQFGELLEDDGSTTTLSGAVMGMLKGKSFSPAQEAAVRKFSPFKYFERLSTRMKGEGMNWLGDAYKEHYPDMNQRFASKFMPIAEKLKGLPDADGILRGYFRKTTANIKQEYPKSHQRILSALRRGDSSRQQKALTDEERQVYRQIRSALQVERAELVKAGFQVGDRGEGYFPQVWNANKISKKRQLFLERMQEYYKVESMQYGRPYTDAEGKAFAEGVMLSLTEEGTEGVYIPSRGSSKNSKFDNVDYARVLELDKVSGGMDLLEEFLEDDLEAVLVKYIEGSSRRVVSTKRFGVNNHAFDDYMLVGREGAEGIAQLLSTNKVFEYDFAAMNEAGRKEKGVLPDTIIMPFTNKQQEAKEFSQQLLEVSQTQGAGAARQMLADIAPTRLEPNQKAVYDKRADAIVGALNDFEGKKNAISYDEGQEYADNAMRILHKKPMHGVNKQGMKVSRGLRFFNNISLLSFTTLTSIGDLGLPIIRSGSFKSWAEGVRNLKDPEYREMIRNVGVAMENIVHERMVNLYGSPDNKASHAFFNATGLTPWTDMNRQIAGATGYETFITMQRKAQTKFVEGKTYADQSRDYKTAHRFLKNYGLSEFLPGAKRGNESLGNRELMSGDKADETLRMAVIKFADDAIFQPNPNDIPMWAQTPVGALVFQLKSFPLMMSRMSGHIIEEANHGNLRPLAYFASLGPAFGMVTLGVKDVIQMRGGDDDRSPEFRKRNMLKALGYDEKAHGGEDDFLGWYIEGMMVMGGLGLLGDVIHSGLSQVDNGAYGQNRMWSTVLGPSFGLGTAGMQVSAGLMDESDNSNSKERSATRELATRIPFLGGNRRFREDVVDTIAGEDQNGSSAGWQ